MFLNVAKQGSFAAVARQLNSDPSLISRHIAALENELGFRLFERSTRRLALTEAGQLIFDRIQAPLDEIDELQNLARDIVREPQGRLRIATSIAFGERWLIPKLGAFRNQYPKIELDLVLNDMTIDLVTEKVDLAIRLGERPAGAYITKRLMPTRYHLVASPHYLDDNGYPQQPADIKSHSCIAFPYSGYQSLWRFKSVYDIIDEVEIKPAMIISNALAMRQAVLHHMGIAMLSDWTIGEDIESGRLVDVFPDHIVSAKNFDTSAWLLYPSKSYVPAKTRALLSFLADIPRIENV